MSRFFFDISDSKGRRDDRAGDEFETIADARAQCQVILAQLVSEELPDGEWHRFACDVRDDAGRTLYRGEMTYRGVREPED